jgi:hypothetical protein
VTFNVVDMAGYVRYRATLSFSVHVVAFFGATSRPYEKRHKPDSRHVFLPFDAVTIIVVNVVRDPLFTTDLFTTNPGRALTRLVVTD